jgi:hypothetical protein
VNHSRLNCSRFPPLERIERRSSSAESRQFSFLFLCDRIHRFNSKNASSDPEMVRQRQTDEDLKKQSTRPRSVSPLEWLPMAAWIVRISSWTHCRK